MRKRKKQQGPGRKLSRSTLSYAVAAALSVSAVTVTATATATAAEPATNSNWTEKAALAASDRAAQTLPDRIGTNETPPDYEDPGVVGDPDSWRTDEFDAAWGMSAIGAHHAYARGLTGAGVSIGQFDTGVDFNHPEFATGNHVSLHLSDPGCTRDDRGTRIVYDAGAGGCMSTHGDEYTIDAHWVFPTDGDPYAYAEYGSHGTHVAGTTVAARDGEGMHGVAFNSRLVSARFFADTAYAWSQNDDGTWDRYPFASAPGGGNLEGVRQIYEQLQQHGARALNIEVQYATYPETTVEDLRQQYEADQEYWDAIADGAIESGIINVVAAGNHSSIPNLYPGLPEFRPDAERYYLAVGSLSLDEDGSYDISDYSNHCAYAMDWCVMAPGDGILSSVIDDRAYGGTIGGSGTEEDPYWFEFNEDIDVSPVHGYADFSGTSMAAPHAIGALALLFERFPYLTGPQVRDVLLTTATDMGEPGVDEIYGWGMINLEKAIDGPGMLLVDTEVFMDQRAGGVQVWEGEAWDDWANDISGPGHLTKAGPGWLRLSGDNSFAGVTVDAGWLELTGNNSLDGDINLNGGQLLVEEGAVLDGDNIAISGGLMTMSGSSTTGDVVVDNGGLRVGRSTSALLAADSLTVNGSLLQAEGSIDVAGDAVINDTSFFVLEEAAFNAATVSISGGFTDIRGSLGTSEFDASGTTLILTGTLDALDSATIQGGSLEIGDDARLNAGSIDLDGVEVSITGELNADGAFSLDSGLLLVEGDFTSGQTHLTGTDLAITSAGSGTLAGLDLSDGDTDVAGDLLTSGDVAFSNSNVSVSGLLDSGGALSLLDGDLHVQDAAGSVVAAGPLDVANGLVLVEGSLAAGPATLADSDFVIAPSGVVELDGLDLSDGILEVAGSFNSTGDLAFQDSDLVVFAADGEDAEAGRLAGGNLSFDNGEATIAGDASVLDAHLQDSTLNVLADAHLEVGDMQLVGTQAVVNGIISGGNTLIDADSSLSGGGTLGNTTVQGLISPGNSIGTLHIEGDYVQAAGSTFEAELLPPDNADLINVSGTATIEGGTIRAIAHPGHYLLGQTYTIIAAEGGLSGEFDAFDVETVSPFLQLDLLYQSDGLLIDVLRGNSIASAAQTYNQLSAATALDELPIDQGLLVPLTQLAPEQAMEAVDQLSGEVHASVQSALIDGSRLVRDAALARAMNGHDSFTSQRDPEANTGAWVEVHRQGGRIKGDGNAAQLRHNSNAALVGIDHQFDAGWRIGALGGIGRTDFDIRHRGAEGDVDSRHLGVYAAQSWGGFGLRAGYTYAWHDVDTERRIRFPGFSDDISGRYDATSWQAVVEGGYRFGNDAWEVEPYLQYAHVSVDTDGFVEDGGPAALSGSGSGARVDLSTVGVRFAVNLGSSLQEQTWLSLRGNVGYRHAGGDQVRNSRMSWDGSEWFNVRGPAVTDESMLLELGVAARTSANTLFEVGYSGVLSDEARDHGANARFSWQF